MNGHMETQFSILLSLKTATGFVTYGKYYLGGDRKAAHQLFDKLKGSSEITIGNNLHIDLMETVDDLPVKINTLCCTLDELALNTKLIAKEIFRLKNLDEIE